MPMHPEAAEPTPDQVGAEAAAISQRMLEATAEPAEVVKQPKTDEQIREQAAGIASKLVKRAAYASEDGRAELPDKLHKDGKAVTSQELMVSRSINMDGSVNYGQVAYSRKKGGTEIETSVYHDKPKAEGLPADVSSRKKVIGERNSNTNVSYYSDDGYGTPARGTGSFTSFNAETDNGTSFELNPAQNMHTTAKTLSEIRGAVVQAEIAQKQDQQQMLDDHLAQ